MTPGRADSQGSEDSDEDFDSFHFSSEQLSDKSSEQNHDIENQTGPIHNELTAPLINKPTFDEARDREHKYQFVMYSPSLEIFKRMHHIFNQLPEVARSAEEPDDDAKD